MKNARFYYSVPRSVVKALVVGTQDFTLDDVVGFYKSSIQPMPRITICSLLNEDRTKLSFGVAVCSAKDRFVKKVGRELAYKRALEHPFKVAEVTKDNIREVRMNVSQAIEEEIWAMNPKKF